MLTKDTIINLYDDAIDQLNNYLNQVNYIILNQNKFKEFKAESSEFTIDPTCQFYEREKTTGVGKDLTSDDNKCKFYRYYLHYKHYTDRNSKFYDPDYAYANPRDFAIYKIDDKNYLKKAVSDRIDHLTLERVANFLKLKNSLTEKKETLRSSQTGYSVQDLNQKANELNTSVKEAQDINTSLSQKYGKVHKSFQQNRKEGHGLFYSLFHSTFFQSRANRALETIQNHYENICSKEPVQSLLSK
jgi:uncharacterized protein YoxC